MIINVNGGHSRLSSGASKYLDEVAEDRLVKNALIEELKKRGHIVSDSTSDKVGSSSVLIDQCYKANKSGAELAVSIHFNAGGGTGCEVWHWPCKDGKRYSTSISSSVAKAMGLRDRGAKESKTLYWLKHTTMTAVIIEVCFVDNKKDYEAYKKLGYKSVAKAIADGIEKSI